MTYSDIIALLVRRIERGVTQRTQIGRDSQWQRVTLCLELHRLMERYKGFGRYELLSLTMQTVYGRKRDKHQCKADLKVYAQMEQAFGDGEWPLPDIHPDLHRKIRNALRCEIEKRKTAADRERRTAEKRSQQQGDRILDTHLGSGSSRIAAHRLGFDFVGIEIDKEYFDASVERFERECKQQPTIFDL